MNLLITLTIKALLLLQDIIKKFLPSLTQFGWILFAVGKLVVDARSFTKVIDKEVVVTSENDNFQIKRALLTHT